MNDDWIRWIIGGVAVTFTGLIRHLYVRQDKFVTRGDLDRTLNDMREERREMHRQNRETLSTINDRVDDLWRQL